MDPKPYNSVWITCGGLSLQIIHLEQGLVKVAAYATDKEDLDPIESFVVAQPKA